MLPKQNRLKKEKDFENVFKNGKTVKCQNLFFKYVPSGEESRIGIVVSKKVSKRAVDRNKVKRRIREIFRLTGDKLKTGFNIIIVAYPSIKDKEFKSIKEEIDSGLIKAGLIK